VAAHLRDDPDALGQAELRAQPVASPVQGVLQPVEVVEDGIPGDDHVAWSNPLGDQTPSQGWSLDGDRRMPEIPCDLESKPVEGLDAALHPTLQAAFRR